MYTDIPFSKIIYVKYLTILGMFAKLRTATISFVVSVLLSVRMEQLGCQWTDFMKFNI